MTMRERPPLLGMRGVSPPIRATSLRATERSLSGGDPHEAFPARLLATAPKRLILDEPTRGVDLLVSTGSNKEKSHAMQGSSSDPSLSRDLSDGVSRAGDLACG